MNIQLQGTIASYIAEKGFGFIARQDGERDIFFHCSAWLGESEEEIQRGMQVSFEEHHDIRSGRIGAVNVEAFK